MSGEHFSYQEVESFTRVTGLEVTAWETKMLLMIHHINRSKLNDRYRSEAELAQKRADEQRARSQQPDTGLSRPRK